MRLHLEKKKNKRYFWKSDLTAKVPVAELLPRQPALHCSQLGPEQQLAQAGQQQDRGYPHCRDQAPSLGQPSIPLRWFSIGHPYLHCRTCAQLWSRRNRMTFSAAQPRPKNEHNVITTRSLFLKAFGALKIMLLTNKSTGDNINFPNWMSSEHK